jgi:hypothetical protein
MPTILIKKCTPWPIGEMNDAAKENLPAEGLGTEQGKLT